MASNKKQQMITLDVHFYHKILILGTVVVKLMIPPDPPTFLGVAASWVADGSGVKAGPGDL